jgi:hypothetical protein
MLLSVYRFSAEYIIATLLIPCLGVQYAVLVMSSVSRVVQCSLDTISKKAHMIEETTLKLYLLSAMNIVLDAGSQERYRKFTFC